MNLPFAVQRPLKFPKKRGERHKRIEERKGSYTGVGSGEVAFNFVLVKDF